MSTMECASQNFSALKETLRTQERCNILSSRNDNSGQLFTGGLVENMKSAFMNRIITLSYENLNEEYLLPEIFLYAAFAPLQIEVKSFLKVNYALKFNIKLHAIYTKATKKHFVTSNQLKVKIFETEVKDLFMLVDFENEFPNLVKNITRQTEHFQVKEGGWTLLRLVKVECNLNKYQPLRGSSYIPLPRKLRLKQACVNVKNKDNYCFKWAVISAISEDVLRAQRPTTYDVNILSKTIKFNGYILDFGGLHFPLMVKDVSIFEENNPGISINVFGYEKQSELVVGPYYKTKNKKKKHVNLLFYEDVVEQNTVGHYVWIKNLPKLLRAQITAKQSKIAICDTCLQHFYRYEEMEKHICGQKKEIVLEEDKCELEFKNYVKTIDVPFVIYANSECLIQNAETCNPMPYVLTYFIKCSYDDNLSKWRHFKGINALRMFAESLINDAKYYYNNYSIKVVPKIPLTAEEKLEYNKNNSCCICSREIIEEKVKLHCRLSGKYRGAAHHACALNHRVPKKFPVIFHNMSYNESLSFIKVFSDIDDDPITMRAVNDDTTNICFTKDIGLGGRARLELRFLSFCTFMPFSLDYLIQNMQKSDFKTLKLVYPDDENKFNLVIRKGVIYFNYLSSIEKLTETSLPSKDNFYNTEDYDHAKNMWSEFECKTLEDYLLLCMKIHVILLTDTFENFRLVCKNAYNLDPCNYHSAAEFSWDAMFKITDIKIKLLTDESMHSFINKGMRGPISQCFQMRSVANNKYLCDYNDRLPSKYIMCFHANDLYGRVMSEPLPDGNFEWETNVENFSLDSIPIDSKIGYILEVDLQYPNEACGIHNTFPFCFENEQSVVDVNHKYNYVIYYKNLQQCLQHGLKLKKIHRILKFSQSDWLKKYILLNKTYKANAKTYFEVEVFELMNNSLYEKIMEKVGKKIRIMHKWESEGRKLGTRALILKPEFSSVTIYDEDTVAVAFNTNPYQYMPIYLEFVISELAKLKIYSFHYEYMLPKYKTNIQLNYVDTDSLIYSITTNDVYKDIANEIYLMINTFDCNTIDKNSRLSLRTLGMMKDANDGVVIKEFLCLNSKCYSLKTETMRETNESDILENNYCNCSSLPDYKNLLYATKISCENINSIKLKLHQSYTKMFNELYLSTSDDNRYICDEDVQMTHIHPAAKISVQAFYVSLAIKK